MEIKDVNERNLLTVILYRIFFVNDLLCTCLYETLGMIKGSWVYRQRVKQKLKCVETAIKAYNKKIDQTGHAEFVAELNDMCEDEVARDYQVLKNSMINFLNKERTPEPDLLGMMYTSSVLSEIAVINVERDIDTYVRDIPYVRRFGYLKPRVLHDAVKALSKEVERQLWERHHYKEVTIPKTVVDAFIAVTRKVTDSERIIKLIHEYDRIHEEE